MKNRGIFSNKMILILNIFALSLFLYLLYSISVDSSFPNIDHWVNRHMGDLRSPGLTHLFIVITKLGGVLGNILFAIAAILYFSYKKWYKERLFYAVSSGGALLLFVTIKQLTARHRPDSGLIEVINYSFPSGHATLTLTTVLALYFVISKKIRSRLVRNMFLAMGTLWGVCIAFTRIYLNAHWFSDVFAGLSLALFWVTLMKLLVYKE